MPHIRHQACSGTFSHVGGDVSRLHKSYMQTLRAQRHKCQIASSVTNSKHLKCIFPVCFFRTSTSACRCRPTSESLTGTWRSCSSAARTSTSRSAGAHAEPRWSVSFSLSVCSCLCASHHGNWAPLDWDGLIGSHRRSLLLSAHQSRSSVSAGV